MPGRRSGDRRLRAPWWRGPWWRGPWWRSPSGHRPAGSSPGTSGQLFHVLRDYVHLKVDVCARLLSPEGGTPERLWDEAHLEPVRPDRGYREADAVHGDRA